MHLHKTRLQRKMDCFIAFGSSQLMLGRFSLIYEIGRVLSLIAQNDFTFSQTSARIHANIINKAETMDTPLYSEVIVLLTAYLLGSIPTGLLVSKLFHLPDPREVGSETIGATNMLRLGDRRAAVLTLFLDAFKGSIAVILALLLTPTLSQLACLLAVIGHIFPVWLGLKGGKGIATAFGAILILSWPLATVCLVTWIAVAATTRYSSLSSLAAVILSPLYTTVLNEDNLVLTCLALACLIFWTHRSNIRRLITGKESQIGETTLSDIPQD